MSFLLASHVPLGAITYPSMNRDGATRIVSKSIVRATNVLGDIVMLATFKDLKPRYFSIEAASRRFANSDKAARKTLGWHKAWMAWTASDERGGNVVIRAIPLASDDSGRKTSRLRLASALLGAVSAILVMGAPASAADLDVSAPVVVIPPPPSGFSGPLAPYFAPLADKGITFHALVLDFFGDNPSIGLQRGRGSNSGYIIEGVDLDLSKLWGLPGTSLHYENTFFAGVTNLNAAPQIGDAQIGFPPPFTPRVARLTRFTVEQKLADGKLDIEAGITHPGYYFAKFNCGTYNACFQDILYLDAGYQSFTFATPGVAASYDITPKIYAELGAFARQPNANAHIGYDFYDEQYNGVLTMGEIGSKTSYATDPYPYKIGLTGYYQTGDHANNFAVGGVPTTVNHSGTSGILVQGEKIVWRRDGGLDPTNATPTALRIYGSFGTSLDTTVAIQEDAWLGATLTAPFQSRPADYYGLKVYWERINAGFANYIDVAGGNVLDYKRDSFTFEASGHIALPLGCAFEPVVDYTVNPNNFWNPTAPTQVHPGFYLGGTVAIPIGVIFGIQAAT